MRNYIDLINQNLTKTIEEAFDDFKDPMFEKEGDEDAEQAQNDFQMFKDEGEVGAPDTAKPQETEAADDESGEACEGDDCEKIGQALNAKDMKLFTSAYTKLCAGAVESINVDEAKELAEIMLALFRSKVEENPIEESNQDNKLAREAAANNEPAPVNPNAPKKPQSPADKRAAVAAAKEKAAAPSGPAPAPSEAKTPDAEADAQTDDEIAAGGEEAGKFARQKGVKP